LTYLVTSKTIDYTIQGFENYVGLMVISKESHKIQDTIFEKIGQGITVYQGIKGYGKNGIAENKEIIHLVLNRIDVQRINRMIDEIDKEAFIIEFDVNDVKGGKIRKFMGEN
jgi:uncharacterized membrane-anchored protein YitT (DUF2179 family)